MVFIFRSKYPCFLCYLGSRIIIGQWVKKVWPTFTSLTPSDKNIKNNPLLDQNKFLFHKLLIESGLMRKIIKGLDHIGDWESKVNTFVQEIKTVGEHYLNWLCYNMMVDYSDIDKEEIVYDVTSLSSI
jgi:D-mannonate dehydratase